MLRKICLITLLVYFIDNCNGQGYYSIVGSKYIRPNTPYHVSVSLHDYTEPCTIKVGIKNKENFERSELLTIEPFTSKIVAINTDDLKSDTYDLFADGQSGIIFHNTTTLTFNGKSFSVFIQTDKSMYKPSDMVKFRVLILDSNTKPATIKGPINVHLLDGSKNRIKQWLKVELNRGVYTNELQLSSFPVLGEWNIQVNVMDETINKPFEVAEFVLPKFEVTIDVPKYTTYKDGVIHTIIRSKYTYGKPVKGEVTVSIFPKFHGAYQPLVSNLITRKTASIDGKAPISFDINSDMKITEEIDFEKEFTIEAIVEEELTGRKQNTTQTIKLTKSKYKFKTIKDIKSYKPGLPFEILVQVVHHDGSPVRDNVNKIEISYGSRYDKSDYQNMTYGLDSNGMALLTFNNTLNETGITVNAKYLDIEERIGFYSKVDSPVNTYLLATLKTENPTINNEIEISVQTTENMRYFTYQVIGRGDILATKTIQVPNQRQFTFKILGTFSMVPKAQLLVYYIKEGEIISDKLEIEFGSDLHNFIKVETSALQANPGQDIDITITTRPNSFIGLLGVDQSVLLLKQGNDITKDDVFNELDLYNSKSSSYSPYVNSNSWADFNNAGAVLLTNAKSPPRTFITSTTLSPYDRDIYDGSAITTIKKTDIGPAHVFKTNTKPPLAGPYAFSRIPKPIWNNRPRIHLMHDIRDTWLFFNLLSGTNTSEIILHKKVPDTITTWVITGFSIDPQTGLGLTKAPRKLQVFQPFFISLNLPYSIKRGEIFALPIVIFNYMDGLPVNAKITLHNTDQEFEFAEMTNEISESINKKIEMKREKHLTISENSGATVSFMIKPKKVGKMTIKVTAVTDVAGDGVERVLPVEPEGTIQYKTKSVYIDLRKNKTLDSELTVEIPMEIVPGSARVTLSVVGDILGSTIKNLNSLIRIPYGCGEQNMINFVPNIVVLNYMKHTDQLSDAIEKKAKSYMELGYQRELTYKHKDGSFSVFGNSDDRGSVWLTAFVARAFQQATVHINVDESIISDALKWLNERQSHKGSFPEYGRVYDSHLQGGANNDLGLTAYTLISFLENKKLKVDYAETIDKAINYIVKESDGLSDVYTLAVTAYALQLANHESKNDILQQLNNKANFDANTKWWTKKIDKKSTDVVIKKSWEHKPNSIDVETTAYALLAHLEAERFDEAIPIVKWLLAQRSDKGGFESTQDTIVGIQALAKFAEHVSAKGRSVEISITDDQLNNYEYTINEQNSIVLQSTTLPSTIKNIRVNATGNGFALLQLAYQYNVVETESEPSFLVQTTIKNTSNSENLHLNICTSFVPHENSVEKQSNMAVMEVSFPSGFVADLDTIPDIKTNMNVKKVETKNGDTVVMIYFDGLDENQLCLDVNGYRTHKIANPKPAVVIVYDYYDNKGRTTIHKKVPDTLTSWVITGLSIDPVTGIGLTRQSTSLDVLKQFQVTMDLPNSIKFGETVAIPIVVYNYMDKSVQAEVTLHNTEQEFEFTDLASTTSNEVNSPPKFELYRRKRLDIGSNTGASISFMIRPKRVGPINVKVTASSPLAGDTVERVLPVQPEGAEEYRTKSMFIDLRDVNGEMKTNFTIDIPKNVIPESTHIEVAVSGDLIGATIKNLNNLLRQPYGCGEQNMIYFVPNIVVLNYLKNTQQITPAIEIKAKQFMEIGYQRQLTYRHLDGSFSAFGGTNETGSTWLTAFVARTFYQASEYIDIEPRILNDALVWLSNQQSGSGSFPEVGNVYHKDMQGGVNNDDIALTAFTVIAFLENKKSYTLYRNTIDRALDYIVRNLDSTNNNYTIAIAAYALQLGEHNVKDYILQSFDSKSTNVDDKKWWMKKIPESEQKNIWYKQPNSINNEMTGYALLAFLEAGKYEQATPIMKWLIEQRNEQGGFQSTQDTFIGIQALAKYAERLSSRNSNVQVIFEYGTGMETRMNVNQDNAIVLQSYELPESIRKVNITANGRGYAIVQLTYRYYVNVTGAWPKFTLDPLVNRNSNPDYLHLTICTSFVPGIGVNESNMAVMEVNFPSGYTADMDTLPSLRTSENIQKVETKNGDTQVILYFKNLSIKELCPTLDAFRTHKVANHKPASVIIYDYYDNSRRARQFYRARKATLCDICEGSDCTDPCRIRAAQRSAAVRNGGTADDDGINTNVNQKNSATKTYQIFSIIFVWSFSCYIVLVNI